MTQIKTASKCKEKFNLEILNWKIISLSTDLFILSSYQNKDCLELLEATRILNLAQPPSP